MEARQTVPWLLGQLWSGEPPVEPRGTTVKHLMNLSHLRHKINQRFTQHQHSEPIPFCMTGPIAREEDSLVKKGSWPMWMVTSRGPSFSTIIRRSLSSNKPSFWESFSHQKTSLTIMNIRIRKPTNITITHHFWPNHSQPSSHTSPSRPPRCQALPCWIALVKGGSPRLLSSSTVNL